MKNLRGTSKCRAIIGGLLALLFSGPSYGDYDYIDSCSDDPPMVSSGISSVNEGTSITLSTTSQSPIPSTSGVELTVRNALVDVTTRTVWGAYSTMCWVCYYDYPQDSCHFEFISFPQKTVTRDGTAYPRGTVSIKQNGVVIGSESIAGDSLTFTTPPLGVTGDVGFVAQFTPAEGTEFTSDTSNTITLKSVLDPSVLAPILSILLSE